MSHSKTTVSKRWENACATEKGLGEKSSLSLNREKNASRKSSADYPSYLIGQDWIPCYPNKKTKGDKLAMSDLYQSDFTPWAWHNCSLPPKIRFHGQGKGGLSNQQSLLYGSGSLLSGDLGSPFVIWTKDPKRVTRNPEPLRFIA